jgi:hypothetical protein
VLRFAIFSCSRSSPDAFGRGCVNFVGGYRAAEVASDGGNKVELGELPILDYQALANRTYGKHYVDGSAQIDVLRAPH